MMTTNTQTSHTMAMRILSLIIAISFFFASCPVLVIAEELLEEIVPEIVIEAPEDDSILDEYPLDPNYREPEEYANIEHTSSVFDPLALMDEDDTGSMSSLDDFVDVASSPQSGADLWDGQGDPFEVPEESILGDADRILDDEPVRNKNATRVDELCRERDEFTKTYSLSDGFFETIVSDAPVHYADKDEVMIDIATDLMPSVRTGDTFGTLAPLSLGADVSFGAFCDGDITTYQTDRWKVGLSYIGAEASTPVRLGDYAYYADVAESTDIEYRNMWWGLKESLVLTAPTDRSCYDFRITFEGLEIERDLLTSDFRLIDAESGEVVFDIGRLEVTDAAFDLERGEFATCEDAYWQLIETGEGFAILRAVIDEDWLADSARVFPVRIDPPVIFTWVKDKTNTSTVDSRVVSASPTQTNPSTTELRIGYYDASTGHNRSYVGPTLPSFAGKRVDSAKLTVSQWHQYYVAASTITYLGEASRKPATTDTWNNKSATAKNNIANVTTTQRAQMVTFDITTFIKNKAASGADTAGFVFYQQEDGSQNTTHWRKYYSRYSGVHSPIVSMVWYPDYKKVNNLTFTTQASEGWFKEVDRNGDGIPDPGNINDKNGLGRGSVKLTWDADPQAKGYLIYSYDGNAYHIVGKTLGKDATSWSSKGSGMWPSGSRIADWQTKHNGTYDKNSLICATTPSDESYLATSKLTHPAGSGSTLTGAGIVALDGSDMYVKKWSTYAGPDQWVQFKQTGFDTAKGIPTYGAGQKIATTVAGVNSQSGFISDGVLYDGWVTRSSGGTSDVKGFLLSSIMDDAKQVTLTFDKPILKKVGGETSAPGAVLMCSDDNYIYSVGGISGTTDFMARIYDKSGSWIKDVTFDMGGQAVYSNFDGITSDGSNLYFFEWGGERRMTKMSLDSGKVVNQWHLDRQASERTVSVAYDKVNNLFVLGQLDGAAQIHYYHGIGLDMADNPNALYRATKGTTYDNNTNYWFRVCPYTAGEAQAPGSASLVMPTLENRTVRVSDAAQRAFVPIAEIVGETVEGSLSGPVARLATIDLQVASPGPVAALSRTYLGDSAFTSAFLPQGWMFSFEECIEQVGGDALYTSADADRYAFISDGSGGYHSPNGMYATLEYDAGIPIVKPSTWTLVYSDGSKKVFDGSSGNLKLEQDRQGRQMTYSFSSGNVTITAQNNQTIIVAQSGNTTTATYATAAGTRTFTYVVSGSTLTVTGYPGTTAALARSYTHSSGKLTGIATAGDSVCVTYGTTSLAAQHIPTTAPPVKHTLTYSSTVDSAHKKAVLERGSTVAVNGFKEGFERDEYLVNLAQQVAWNSTSMATNEGMYHIYDSENNLIVTQKPTVYSFASNKLKIAPINSSTYVMTETSTYDAYGNLVRHQNENGGVTEHFYNEDNDLIKTIDPSRGVTWLSYDTLGRLTSTEKLIDMESNSIEKSRNECQYDSSHNLIQTRRAIKKQGNGFVWEKTSFGNFAPNGAPQQITFHDVMLSTTATPINITETLSIDAFGNTLSQSTALGKTTSTTFDVTGRPVTQTDPSGALSHTVYDAAGRIKETYTTVSSIPGQHGWTKHTYNTAGNNTLTQQFSSAIPGQEVSRIDRLFDVLGREVVSDDSDLIGKETTTFQSNTNTITTTEEGIPGTVSDTLNYDSLERPVAETNTLTPTLSQMIEYDDKNNTETLKYDGNTQVSSHNEAGNLEVFTLKSASAGGATVAKIESTYNLAGEVTATTETRMGIPGSIDYEYEYDLLGREISAHLVFNGQDPSKTVYNTLGWVLAQRDFDGVDTLFEYSADGDVLVENKGGLITTTQYDSAGRISQSTKDDGTTVTFGYDPLGRVTQETHANSGVVLKDISTTYNEEGRVTSEQDDVSGWQRTYLYFRRGSGDGAYLETSMKFSMGDIIVEDTIHGNQFVSGAARTKTIAHQNPYTYFETMTNIDNYGRMISRKIGCSTYLYDYGSKGLISYDSALSPVGETTYVYSDGGHKLLNTNYGKLGQKAAYTYTADEEELATARIGLSALDTYSFDTAKNLAKVTGGPSTATFSYSAGRVATKTAPPSSTTPSPPNISSFEDPNTSFTYSPSASWVSINSTVASGGTVMRASANNALVTFTFVGSEFSIMASKNSTAGKIEITLDNTVIDTIDLYNATTVAQAVFGPYKTTEGVHSVKLKMLIANQQKVDFDKITVTGLCPQIIKTVAPASSTATYEDNNAAITYAGLWTNPTNVNYSAGSHSRTDQNGASASFTFKGKSVKIIGTKANNYGKMKIYLDGGLTPVATTDSYAATTAYQQTLATITAPTDEAHTIRIVTELTSSRPAVAIDAITVTGVAPKIAEWFSAGDNTPVTTTYNHNGRGQRTIAWGLAQTHAYSWAGSRLHTVITPELQITNAYDGDGQRVRKTVTDGTDTTSTDYIYNGLRLLALTEDSQHGRRQINYLYGGGITPVGAFYSNGSIHSIASFEIISDIRGDVRELRDYVGSTFARFDYDAYGNIRSEEIIETIHISQWLAEEIVAAQPLRYAGYVWDSETQLYYCSQRYYDPSVGAFISRDPVKADGEQTGFGYCLGDPINLKDSTGMWGSDVHYGYKNGSSWLYGTRRWATDRGMSASHADIVASANQSVDNWSTSAVFFPGRHFRAHGAYDYANTRYNSAVSIWKNQKKLTNASQRTAEKKKSLEELGRALHALQDYYAHLNWTIGKHGIVHQSWKWVYKNKKWQWESSTKYFDDVNYNVWQGSDGYFYHNYVGRLNNPRYKATRDATVYWIDCFKKSAGY